MCIRDRQQITNSIDEIQSTGILQQNGNGKSQEMQGAVSWNKFFGDALHPAYKAPVQ